MKQTKEDLERLICEGLIGDKVPNIAGLPKPMTDRDKLAEKLFIETHRIGMDGDWYANNAKGSIYAANIFFNVLEGKTDEDE